MGDGRDPTKAPTKGMVEGTDAREGSNRGLRHGDVTGVPSNPAIRQLAVQEAQARPQDPQKCPL